MKNTALTSFLLLTILLGCSNSDNPKMNTMHSYNKAFALIQSVQDVLILKDNQLYLKGVGMYDLSTRMQGMQPNTEEGYEITEQLSVDLESGKVAYESDTYVNPDAHERIKYTYDGKNRMLFVDLLGGFAFWNAHTGINDQAKRYSNMIPHMLVEEANLNKKSLKYLGKNTQGSYLVSFHSNDYGSITILIDEQTKFITGVEYLKDMPLKGDSIIRWKFKDYKEVNGIGFYPTGYTVFLNDKVLKDISYSSIRTNDDNKSLSTIPGNIDIPEMPDIPVESDSEIESAPSPIRDAVQLADNVYVMPHIRPGFHPMVIEFNEYLMVVDPPAGWFEMHQLPAMQWVDGATSSSTGERLLDGIRQKISDKPIKYVVLTHHHSDHAGGLRPFVAEGATLLSSETTASVLKEAIENSFTLEPDRLTQQQVVPKIELVHKNHTISDDSMEVQLIDVGKNPHTKGMLVIYLPTQKILYQSDLFEPTNMNFFPNKARVPVMKWFVSWLDSSSIDAKTIYAIHAGLRVTDEHLNKIRQLD